MNQVRLGVIGCGGMFRYHAKYFASIPELRFTAGCDIEPTALKFAVDTYGVEGFTDGHALLESGLVDAVLIATPHYFHPGLTIEAFKAGLHVLCEKPVAVTAKAAQQMNEAHARHKKLVFAAMFMMRMSPMWRKVKEMVDGGAVGRITRVNWIVTDWFRSQAYYNSGGWRATWGGEGGGVLLNQCPHNLDLLTWICGVPNRVVAQATLGKFHQIEVEDEVSALLTYPNGATGFFCTTTGEAPGTNRLEIAGDSGRIIAGGSHTIEWVQTTINTARFCKTTRESFAVPPTNKIVIEAGGKDLGHMGITMNFVNAILHGEKLIAPAEEGIRGLELGNAMLMSGLTGKPVSIPTNRNAYDALIRKLARTSKAQKTVQEARVDMGASFR